MTPLLNTATNKELLDVVHQWVRLLELEEYEKAYSFIDPVKDSGWTPDLIKQFIEGYGDAEIGQRVTFEGKQTDISQRVEVTRWEENQRSEVGEICYDLNINGFVSDITATFSICTSSEGFILKLSDIHVM